MAEISPDKLAPDTRMAAERLRVATEAHMTPEQRYERFYNKLPKAAQYVAPGTMGEAGFAGASALATAGALAAPETFGASMILGLPLAGATMMGALQDPKNKLANAAYEGGKGLLNEVVGGVLTKATDLGARFVQKTGMLNRTAARVGQGLSRLFSRYPLAMPQTARELEGQVASGKLANASGERLGSFRDALKKIIPEYKPGVAAQLVNASSGVATHYTDPVAAQGQRFILPDINRDGEVISRHMSIEDAIDHVRELQAEGWTTGGTAKSAATSWQIRQTAHDARTALIAQLNKIQPKLGDTYSHLSGDYGASSILEDVFKKAYRPDGQLDQPKLLANLRKEMPDIFRLKGQGALSFLESIGPLGREARPELTPMVRMHAGESGIRSIFHPPLPYKPETRALITQPWRALSSKKAIPVVGLGAVKGVEDVVGE